ncbi:ABC transporter ATP-binding protein [Bacteroidota bacterium]|nr:ABC transporter ATP-binding protein [Bacteroidota bacterium]
MNSPEGSTIIRVEHLIKSFDENVVLNDFNVSLEKGKNLVILGRSGSGKSVLLKCIMGLEKPDSGKVEVFGKNIPELNQKNLDAIRKKIGFLFQGSALYDSMTVKENLEFPMRQEINKNSRNEIDERIKKALKSVGLPGTENMMPTELSGGMKKRIGLARAIIRNPEIILYDEPTAGLDPVTGKEISHLIVEIQNQYNTSAIIITHDISCAKIAANKIVVLENGICKKEGTYDEMLKSDDKAVKQFFE